MYVFQLFYAAMYAGRNKRVMKYFQFENILDTCILLISMVYLSVLLRVYRYNTFLKKASDEDHSLTFFE